MIQVNPSLVTSHLLFSPFRDVSIASVTPVIRATIWCERSESTVLPAIEDGAGFFLCPGKVSLFYLFSVL